MRALGIDPVSDTRETYRALLSAMSRPGTIEELPGAPADHRVVATLVDHEVTLHTDDGALKDALSSEGRLSAAGITEAGVIHALGTTDGRVREARRGTLKEPSRGATVVYRVDGLSAGSSPAGVGDGDATQLAITGPGVPDTRHLAVAGLPAAEAEAIREAQDPFPRGVDVVFAADDRIAALPRSVSLEVA